MCYTHVHNRRERESNNEWKGKEMEKRIKENIKNHIHIPTSHKEHKYYVSHVCTNKLKKLK